jgi:hypothetical protein
VRVLKLHKINDKHRFECSGCRSLLEVDDKELAFVADPHEGDAYTFTCCVCSEENWVAGNIVHVSRERGSHE